MAGCVGKPGELGIGFGVCDFLGLLVLVNPLAVLPVHPPLHQACIPHRPTCPGHTVGVRKLIRGESNLESAARKHATILSKGSDSHLVPELPPLHTTGTP